MDFWILFKIRKLLESEQAQKSSKYTENCIFEIVFWTPSKSQKSILYSESTLLQLSNNGLKRCCSCRNDGEIRCVSEGKKCDRAAVAAVQAPILGLDVNVCSFIDNILSDKFPEDNRILII